MLRPILQASHPLTEGVSHNGARAAHLPPTILEYLDIGIVGLKVPFDNL